MSRSTKISIFSILIALISSVIYLYQHEFQQLASNLYNNAPILKQNTRDTRYVLIIDAGSAGSRIHIYTFDHQSSDPQLVNEEFDYVIPGLSSYENPQEAALSLTPLIEKAMEIVPEHCHHYTPIAVKATAGLRLLGSDQSAMILNLVRDMLYKYPFRVNDVEILDGKHEGVYAWTTVNYLLGNLNTNNTAAVFDLGGASAQVVFEPDFSVYPEQEAEQLLRHGDDHQYDMKFGDAHHKLYQHSHLGFGLMTARQNIHKTLIEQEKGRSLFWNELKIKDGDVFVNPCIATGQRRTVKIDTSSNNNNKNLVSVEMVGPDEPNDGKQCLELAKQVLKLDKHCATGHCAFNGVHQPSIVDTFSSEPLYIVSYFYDRIFPLNVEPSFPLEKLFQLTETVCQGEAAWQREYYHSAMDELNDRPEWCLDLSYMTVLLNNGYGIPHDRRLTIGKQVDGYGLSWTLGAALRLLKLPIEVPELDE